MLIRRFNFGGIFGGIVCAAAAAAIVYLLSNRDFPPRAIKVVALAGFVGAAVGNWIWGLAAPSEPEPMWGQTINRDPTEEKP
jgi:hypothetical protein